MHTSQWESHLIAAFSQTPNYSGKGVSCSSQEIGNFSLLWQSTLNFGPSGLGSAP